jgi:Mu-like prophage DNA circulation protein
VVAYPGSYGARVSATLNAQLQVVPAINLARACADVLAQESIMPSLSPVDLGRLADDARSRVQLAIDAVEAAYDLVQLRPIADSLRQVAYGVLDAARAVIEARPPIVQRAAPAASNLHRIAHLLYGDWLRSYELARLNPQIRNPNFIPRGALLNAYAN